MDEKKEKLSEKVERGLKNLEKIIATEKKNTEDWTNEFSKIIKPAMKWLAKNYSPHAYIIVTSTNANVTETDIGFVTKDYIEMEKTKK